MDDDNANKDLTLLARLNALKQSNVVLETPAKGSLLKESADSHQDETPDDLLLRFQKLYGSTNVNPQGRSREAGSDSAPPSPSIEELVAELEPEDQYTLSSRELQEAEQLLAEARTQLQKEIQEESVAEEHSVRPPSDTAALDSEHDEEAEAEASLQKILDEVGTEEDGNSAPERSPSTHHDTSISTPLPAPPDSFSYLVFPSTPDTIPPSSLDLPSAPSTAPSVRKAEPKAKGFSDEEIDSWCIICCANATVTCFGCDKDLYCWGCWREGHVGDDVGLEEKSHVWERVKKAKKG